MAGYLRHLAAKASAAHPAARPVVQPRVPSRFEPVPVPVGGSASGFSVVEEERVVAQPPAVHREAPAMAQPVAASEHVSQMQAPVQKTVVAEGRDVVVPRTKPPQDRQHAALAGERIESVRERERVVETHHEVEVRTARPVNLPDPAGGQAEAQHQDHFTQQVVREYSQPSDAMQAKPVITPRITGRETQVEVAETIARPQPTAPVTVATPTEAVRPVNTAAPPVATAVRDPFQSDAQVETPTIHVTIGRLIVEAVTAPAAPAAVAARAQAGPRLGLDDYLRQRGGRA